MENVIIHSLFDNTDLCRWISNIDLDDSLNHQEFQVDVKNAYLEYLELIN